MYQIIYISKAKRRFEPDELLELCKRSSAHNREVGVTGLLLYDGARFIQALEGDEQAVRDTMRRISKDRRHNEIDYISSQAVHHRQFGD